MSRGLFITVEGGDGAGKSTQAAVISDLLARDRGRVVCTREPGGTPVGLEIRRIVLETNGHLDAKAEALLFAADRAQHIATVVRPALERGDHVVQDRYIDSSVAYQGAGRALDPDAILRLSAWATDDLMPDLTVLLDIDPAIAADRICARSGTADRMEAETLDFRTRLRQGFLNIAHAEPDRFLVVDATASRAQISALIERRVLNLLAADRRS